MTCNDVGNTILEFIVTIDAPSERLQVNGVTCQLVQGLGELKQGSGSRILALAVDSGAVHDHSVVALVVAWVFRILKEGDFAEASAQVTKH